MSAEQLRPFTNHEMELANAEKLFARIIQQLDEGNYVAGLDVPTAALTVIKQIQSLEKRVAATRASQVTGAQGPLEKTSINIEVEIERARGQELIKCIIHDYEKAYLKSLKREAPCMVECRYRSRKPTLATQAWLDGTGGSSPAPPLMLQQAGDNRTSRWARRRLRPEL